MMGEWDRALSTAAELIPELERSEAGSDLVIVRTQEAVLRVVPGRGVPRGAVPRTRSSSAVGRARSRGSRPTRCSSAAPVRLGLGAGGRGSRPPRARGSHGRVRAAVPTTSPICPRRCGRRSRPATRSSRSAFLAASRPSCPCRETLSRPSRACCWSARESTRRRRTASPPPPPAGTSSACPTKRGTPCSAGLAASRRSDGRRRRRRPGRGARDLRAARGRAGARRDRRSGARDDGASGGRAAGSYNPAECFLHLVETAGLARPRPPGL